MYNKSINITCTLFNTYTIILKLVRMPVIYKNNSVFVDTRLVIHKQLCVLMLVTYQRNHRSNTIVNLLNFTTEECCILFLW